MTDEDMGPLCREIYETALTHDDRYLLMRRHGRRESNPPSELDLKYEACDKLVFAGVARWIRSGFAPGIELTGKPFAG